MWCLKIFKYYVNENNLKLLTITLPEKILKANIILVDSVELFTQIRSASCQSKTSLTNINKNVENYYFLLIVLQSTRP